MFRMNILLLADELDESLHQMEVHRNRRRARRLARETFEPFNDLTEAEFIKTFRLQKSTARSLVQELTPYIPQPRRSDGLSVALKVLITLAFYASGSYQTLVGQSGIHNVSQKSVSRSVRQVTEALNLIYANHLKWPTQQDQRNTIKANFYRKFQIPGVLGCIDGTHVAIIRPHEHEERYYNRKGFHSLNVMIICDSELNILSVDASHPGSAHDASVWQSHPLSSQLTEMFDNGEQVFLLGDSGYPLRKTLMTPILNAVEGTPQRYYYQKHVTARNTVERCIGVLKARFRCLLAARALHYSPIMAGKIVNACCVLHNIANKANAPVPALSPEEEQEFIQEYIMTGEIHQENLADQQNRRVNPDLVAGRVLQQALVEKLWQDRTNSRI